MVILVNLRMETKKEATSKRMASSASLVIVATISLVHVRSRANKRMLDGRTWYQLVNVSQTPEVPNFAKIKTKYEKFNCPMLPNEFNRQFGSRTRRP